MSYVIYNKVTTIILKRQSGGVGCYRSTYETEGAAKAGLTRFLKKDPLMDKDLFGIAEASEFRAKIEKKEVRTGIVHSEGKTFEVGVNTSWTSGPWSETYWCS